MSLSKKVTGILLTAGIFVCAVAQTTPDSRIRVNTVGFLPDFPKMATIAAKGTAGQFTVNSDMSGNVLFGPVTMDSVYNSDTRESLWIADFSGFTRVGTYYIDVPGVGRSPSFRIAPTVFKETYRTMMLGMYLWRCGNQGGVRATYNSQTYTHGQCHTNDGYMNHVDGSNTKRDGTGGWHDAGDYNKYVVNSGVSVGLMLKAWEHFFYAIDTINLAPVTKSGQIPAYLMEAKWNLDWVAKMQLSDGTVSHKLTTLDFGAMNILPTVEDDEIDIKHRRFYMPASTAAAGAFVGMLAQAARIYKPYDEALAEKWLTQARRSYDILINSAAVRPNNTLSQTGPYDDYEHGGNDSNKRLWAAAEMWETTGEQQYLDTLEARLGNSGVSVSTEWGNVNNLAVLTYLTSRRAGKDPEIANRLRTALVNTADGIVNTTNGHGYGRTFGTTYYWGTNGAVASTAYTLNTAYLVTGDAKYRHATQDAMSHLLGRNYYGRSYVTGIGYDPPKNPHCRRSVASKQIWPGYLIGGPHSGKNDAPSNLRCSDADAAKCWFDNPNDYWTNEIAINWNTAMIYALAGLMPEAGVYPAPPYPGQTVEVEVSVKHNATAKDRHSSSVKTSRIVNVRNGGRLNIPHGAKVYTLDGRLVAHRKAGAPMPNIKRNGVYIIKLDMK